MRALIPLCSLIVDHRVFPNNEDRHIKELGPRGEFSSILRLRSRRHTDRRRARWEGICHGGVRVAGEYLKVEKDGGVSPTLARTPLYVRLCRGLNIKTRAGSKVASGKIKKEERKDCIRVLGYRWSRSAFPSAER